MAQAILFNGEKYWNGKGWSESRSRAAVIQTLKKAKKLSKSEGGTVYRVRSIVLEGEKRNERVIEKVVKQEVIKPIPFAYVTWRYSSIDPGRMLGCYDTVEEANQRASEEMESIKGMIVRGKFVKVRHTDEPCITLWHNKWDDHIAILKLPVQ